MISRADEPESVSQWIALLKADNSADAAQELYARYVNRLMTLARAKLDQHPRRLADEEDVAHCALASFFRQVGRGSFPQLNDRQDLWQILIMLTDRRVVDLKRKHYCRKRGAGCEVGESAMAACRNGTCYRPFEQVIDQEPTADFAAEFIELCDRLVAQLDDPLLRQIAARKLEGRTNDEIAEELGCVRRTVQRKLSLIRNVWQESGLTELLTG